jgi:uncharacterized protein YkwD
VQSAAAGASSTLAPTKKSPACAGANLRPSATNGAAVDAATLCLIDRVRAVRHLRPLRANGELGSVATGQVRSMVRRNYFADVSPSGQTPISLVSATRYRTHAARLSVGQNIAWGTGSYASPARVVAAWMASPAHRRIILTRGYRDAGVGVIARLPSRLASAQGATYAIELGARH